MKRPARAALYACLATTIGAGAGTTLWPIGVGFLVAGFVFGWRALRVADGDEPGLGVACGALSVCAALGVLNDPPSPTPAWYQAAHRALPALAIVLVGVFAAGSPSTKRRIALALLLLTSALALLTPLALPSPRIDVWAWNQHCARALLDGIHPYATQAPDIYRGAFDYGYRTNVLPYMPLVVLADAPAVALAGDYRYLLALCIPSSAWLLRAAGRRLGVAPSTIDLLTMALVLHPRLVYIVAFGWSEPLLVLALATFVYRRARSPGGIGQAIAFYLLPSLKQYALAPALLYVASRPRPRALLVGLAVAAATVAPFLLWNARATVDGLLFSFRHTTFRADSLSLTAAIARLGGGAAPKWLGLAAQLAVAALAWAFARRRGAGALLVASALAVHASFLLGSQAFINYYLFVEAAYLAGALMLEAE